MSANIQLYISLSSTADLAYSTQNSMNAVSIVDVRTQLARGFNRVACSKKQVVLSRRVNVLVAVMPMKDVTFLDAFKNANSDSTVLG